MISTDSECASLFSGTGSRVIILDKLVVVLLNVLVSNDCDIVTFL